MTCIVGVKYGDDVFLGGDSAGVRGYDLRIRTDEKVFKVENMIFGFTSSFRMGQLLRYGLKIPKQKCKDDFQYLCTDFINAVRKTLKDGGYTTIDKSVEIGGVFLFGYKGNLYRVDSDYQIGKSVHDIEACGCGEDYALGSLYMSEGKPPEVRIKKALEAASFFSAGVAPPFNIISLNKEG